MLHILLLHLTIVDREMQQTCEHAVRSPHVHLGGTQNFLAASLLIPHVLCPGLVPEQLVQQLAAKKVDYNFGEITRHTRKMTAIFAKAYAGCQVHARNTSTHQEQGALQCHQAWFDATLWPLFVLTAAHKIHMDMPAHADVKVYELQSLLPTCRQASQCATPVTPQPLSCHWC